MDEAVKPSPITRQNAQYYGKSSIVSTVDLCTPSLETQDLEPVASRSSHSHQHSLFKQDICTSSQSHQNFKVEAGTPTTKAEIKPFLGPDFEKRFVVCKGKKSYLSILFF